MIASVSISYVKLREIHLGHYLGIKFRNERS